MTTLRSSQDFGSVLVSSLLGLLATDPLLRGATDATKSGADCGGLRLSSCHGHWILVSMIRAPSFLWVMAIPLKVNMIDTSETFTSFALADFWLHFGTPAQ